MAQNPPVDMSNPLVKEYLTLVRLQVLTPLSLAANIVTVLICSLVVTPSIRGVEKQYPSSISPQPWLIAIYILLLYVGQLGYCVLLVLVQKQETKQTIIKGVGYPLVLANFVMAAWAITWVFKWFLASTILLGLLVVLLIYPNVAILITHPPELRKRPFDVMFIHAPLRFFLVLPLTVMLPYSLFVTLGLTWKPSEPEHYTDHQWIGFAVVLLANLIGLVVIVARSDFVWCVASVWINIAIWSTSPKPRPVIILGILFMVLHPIALAGVLLWRQQVGRREGRIRLPENGSP